MLRRVVDPWPSPRPARHFASPSPTRRVSALHSLPDAVIGVFAVNLAIQGLDGFVVEFPCANLPRSPRAMPMERISRFRQRRARSAYPRRRQDRRRRHTRFRNLEQNEDAQHCGSTAIRGRDGVRPRTWRAAFRNEIALRVNEGEARVF